MKARMEPGRVELSGQTRRIGTATLTAAKTFVDRSFATASWWQSVLCEPQTVALRSDGCDVYYAFGGTIKQAYFPSSLLGVTAINPDDEKKIDTPASVSFHLYDYQAGAMLAGAESGPERVTLALDDEYGVMSEAIASSEGGTLDFWRLTMPGDGHPLTIAWVRDEPDPEWWLTVWVIYGVTYRGKSRGEVRVRRGHQQDAAAMDAAEELVFGGEAGQA